MSAESIAAAADSSKLNRRKVKRIAYVDLVAHCEIMRSRTAITLIVVMLAQCFKYGIPVS